MSERHWAADGANWEKADYYDWPAIYYAWWARTGNAVHRARGDATALDYRTKYLEAHHYKATPHWAQLDGVALHYRLTGDEASRTAVCRTAAFGYLGDLGKNVHEYMENRQQGHVRPLCSPRRLAVRPLRSTPR